MWAVAVDVAVVGDVEVVEVLVEMGLEEEGMEEEEEMEDFGVMGVEILVGVEFLEVGILVVGILEGEVVMAVVGVVEGVGVNFAIYLCSALRCLLLC